MTTTMTTARLGTAFLLGAIGICEWLTTSAWFDPDLLPRWLALPVVTTGFFAVLFLWSFFGNAIVAIASLLLLRGAWKWPLWVAALVSAPFWIVTYRLSPKPW